MYYALFRHRNRKISDFLLWTGFETVERAIDYSKNYSSKRFLLKVIEVEGGQAGRNDMPRRIDKFWNETFPNIHSFIGGSIKYDHETM